MLRLLLWALLGLPFWYAPGLVHWGGHGAFKALFFSCVAVWRNKLAFLVYIGAGVGGLFLLSVVSQVLMALVGLSQVAGLVGLPLILMFFTVMYASLFFTFVDSFEMSADPVEPG